jgi:hypothetical protein
MYRPLWIAALLLLGGCAGWTSGDRLDMFDTAARRYGQALRWSDFETAAAFVQPAPGAPAPNLARFKDVRVTGYEEAARQAAPDGHSVQQVVRIQYVRLDRMSERTATDRQRWVYSAEDKRWYLASGLPELP